MAVVRALGMGQTMEEIASRRGVKATTVKSQLEAVFRKSGAEGQRDLMRILMSLPQLNLEDG